MKTLKIYQFSVVFREFPDEVTLAINIANCPCHCPGCHSSYLAEDIGDELTSDLIDELISTNDGVTCIGFMGGDCNPDAVIDLAKYIKLKYGLKVGWYSGRDRSSDNLILEGFTDHLDYIKVGPFIANLGGLDRVTTNQVMYQVTHDNDNVVLLDITNKFQDGRD